MNARLKEKLSSLPTTPGVYFHKNKNGEIIYVGKAANLKNRVKSYFINLKNRDPKTIALVNDIEDTDWVELSSELEALFFEGEMIRRYLPKYNILLRDDKSLVYIRIDLKSDYPTVTITRRPLDDDAQYFGPYLSSTAIKKALRYLRKIFPYATKKNSTKRSSLDFQLGLDPGLDINKTSLEDYRNNLKNLIQVLKGNKAKLIKNLEKEMSSYAKELNFEQAKKIRNQISALTLLDKKVIFSESEFADINKDHAINELVSLLSLSKYPTRIEGYDISHQQGTDVVASMVVFTNGVSDKANYRKFKTKKDINNDFYNMHETIRRRLSKENLKRWGSPDIMLIDGGKGQLDAAIKARNDLELNIPMIGLAKKREEIVIDKDQSNVELNTNFTASQNAYINESSKYILVDLPNTTNCVKLLQRIRDESHRFAVSYHTSLKRNRQTKSELLEINGIGDKTRKTLIKEFGSIPQALNQSEADLAVLIGKTKANKVKKYLK